MGLAYVFQVYVLLDGLMLFQSPYCGCVQVTKLHHDLEEQIHTNTQLLAENSAKQVELKGKDDEILAAKVELQKINKVMA